MQKKAGHVFHDAHCTSRVLRQSRRQETGDAGSNKSDVRRAIIVTYTLCRTNVIEMADHSARNAHCATICTNEQVCVNGYSDTSTCRQIPALPGLTKEGNRVMLMRGVDKDLPTPNVSEAMKV